MSEAPPIPSLSEPPNWGRLPIEECGEPLVPLVSGVGRIRTHSLYAEQKIPGADEQILVRAGVYDRLRRAVRNLPVGISLVVFDGFRPLTVQQHLWDGCYAEVEAAYPDWTRDAIIQAVSQFVATPTADPACPPPHRTGGAVDVYLVQEDGLPAPMGTAPDEMSPMSVTHYFEEHFQEPYTTNRRLLFHAMTAAGFTNYLGEWWHYDYGNQRWANCSGGDCAIYGLADVLSR